MPKTLKASDVKAAAEQLACVDPALSDVLARHGPPPLWKRPASFSTLVHVLLEQQVSLVSASATFKRLNAACEGRVTASRVTHLGTDVLREIGFTRQKARYATALVATPPQ